MVKTFIWRTTNLGNTVMVFAETVEQAREKALKRWPNDPLALQIFSKEPDVKPCVDLIYIFGDWTI